MGYKLVISNEKIWAKDCSKISRKFLEKIFFRIEQLENDPWTEDLQVKRLKNYKLADFRLRVGGYRVLLDRNISEKTIILYRILPRKSLY